MEMDKNGRIPLMQAMEELAMAARDYTDKKTGTGSKPASIDLGMRGAQVGQVPAVAAIDESGKPTAYTPVTLSAAGTGSGISKEAAKLLCDILQNFVAAAPQAAEIARLRQMLTAGIPADPEDPDEPDEPPDNPPAPTDTSPRIAKYEAGLGTGWDYVENASQATHCVTEFYDIDPSDTKGIIYYKNTQNNTASGYNRAQFITDGEIIRSRAFAAASMNKPFEENLGCEKFRMTLLTAEVSGCYMYGQQTGKIYFAGSDTPYYGKSNISEV